MANLETLELTIHSNATGAKQGIDSLITSLSALPAVVRKATSELVALNAQLAKLKSFSGLKLPNIGNTSGAGKVAKGASGVPHNVAESFAKSQTAESIARMKLSGITNQLSQELANPNSDNYRLASLSERYQKIQDSLGDMTKRTSLATKAAQAFGEHASNAMSKVGRMASTMVTRMALKALIKNFTEAWKSAYNFSKKMGGDFAANIDKVRGALGNMATNVIKAFSPLMNVVAPIISVIATGIEYLTKAITGLLSLLGLASDLIGHSAEQIGSYGDSTKKTAKDVTASFDELNVLSDNNSSGSGSGSKSTFSSKLQEELDSIKMIVAESMLAVGLLLAFSGHVGVGLAMAAVGAAVIVGTIVEKWGTLPDKVKGEITTIMAIAGGAMLALGAIIAFACPAKLGLGIALMVAGVANMVTAASLSWNLSDEIKQQVGKISAIVGGSLIAIGAVLALSGAATPLGIGMMIAGGISLASAVALNWDTVKEKVITVFNQIKDAVVKAWDKIKEAIGKAWDKYMGWTGIKWSDISEKWGKIKEGLKGVWENVKGYVEKAWDKVKNWTTVTWDAVMKGDWETVKEQFKKLWGSIGNFVNNAWKKVKNWFSAKWEQFGGWDGIKEKLKELWGSIGNFVSNAWKKVKNWFEAKWQQFGGWEGIKEKFKALWGSIGNFVGNAWKKVKNWIDAKLEKFGGWDGIKEKLSGVWDGVKKAVSEAWGQVLSWLGISESQFTEAWNAVKDFFVNTIWSPIQKGAEDVWKAICEFWNDPLGKVTEAWQSVSTWFYDNVIKPIKDWWHSLFGGGEDGPEAMNVDLSQYIDLSVDPSFVGYVHSYLEQTMREVLTPKAIEDLKTHFPTLSASDLFIVTDFSKLGDNAKVEFLSSIIQVFGADGIKTIREKIPNISADNLINIVGMTNLAEDKKKELIADIDTEFKKTATTNSIKTGLTGAVSGAVAAAKSLLNTSGQNTSGHVIDGVNSKQGDMKKAGAAISKKEIEGIDSKQKELETAGTRVAKWVNKGVSEQNAETKDAGVNISSTIISGIQSRRELLIITGQTVATYVIQGMKKKESAIKTAAESWHKIIDTQLSKTHEIKVAADSDSVTKMTNGISNSITNISPTVTVKSKFEDKYPGQLKTDIENLSPTITVSTKFGNNQLTSLKTKVEEIKPVITANVKAGDLTAFGTAVKDAIVAALKKIKLSATSNDDGTLTLEAKAQGGIVSGDLFVANENGIPEMIGRFGNQTGVANNDQIVAGIANGVAAANAEQNNLLRRQNEILLGILQKEGDVHIGASSALGRVVSQSMKMYGQMVGV